MNFRYQLHYRIIATSSYTTISCRWQNRATNCITAKLQVDAQTDKLATELSWERLASKVANFQLPCLHLTYPTYLHLVLSLGWPCLSFAEIFGIRKTRIPGLSCGVVCVILRLAVSVEHRLVTDRKTDTRWQLIPTLTSIARVKRLFPFT